MGKLCILSIIVQDYRLTFHSQIGEQYVKRLNIRFTLLYPKWIHLSLVNITVNLTLTTKGELTVYFSCNLFPKRKFLYLNYYGKIFGNKAFIVFCSFTRKKRKKQLKKLRFQRK